ncbi:hypothetical protein NQ024_07325 [Corynebacterium sp. 35RC1]|nr:hypothetical protein [Corynebacterium sp. 35RC1]
MSKQRRRVKRLSDVPYDRTWDTDPIWPAAIEATAAPDVEVEGSEESNDLEFYQAQRPPHYGE